MSRHPNWGALPPAAELRRIYLAGNLSLDQLAKKYGTRRNSVYNKLRRHAQANDLSWPLKRALPGSHRRGALRRWDAVRTDLLRDEIVRCRWEHGVTYIAIAERANLAPNHLYQITSGLMTRVSRPIAERLAAAIDQIDCEATGVDWNEYQQTANGPQWRPGRPTGALRAAVDERRHRVAEMTAAGLTARVIAKELGVLMAVVEHDRAYIRKQAA